MAEEVRQRETWASEQRTELRSKCAAERRKADAAARPRLEEVARSGATHREALQQQFRTAGQRSDGEINHLGKTDDRSGESHHSEHSLGIAD